MSDNVTHNGHYCHFPEYELCFVVTMFRTTIILVPANFYPLNESYSRCHFYGSQCSVSCGINLSFLIMFCRRAVYISCHRINYLGSNDAVKEQAAAEAKVYYSEVSGRTEAPVQRSSSQGSPLLSAPTKGPSHLELPFQVLLGASLSLANPVLWHDISRAILFYEPGRTCQSLTFNCNKLTQSCRVESYDSLN